ncbi:MAG: multiheme c-type cytochrome [bacterium]
MRLTRVFTVLATMILIASVSYTAKAAPTYVGVNQCKMCHMKQYNVWKDTAHAKAFDALKPADQANPKCISCHTTGDNKELKGVQCEACHGPGSEYKSFAVMKNVKEAEAKGLVAKPVNVCTKCHNKNSPTFKGFDFNTAWPKIKHGL